MHGFPVLIFFHPDCNCWSRSFTESADTEVSGRGLYRQWGIAPRPETNFLTKSIARYCGAVKPPFRKVCTFFVKVCFHLSFLAPGGRVCYHNMRCEKTQEVFHDFLDP